MKTLKYLILSAVAVAIAIPLSVVAQSSSPYPGQYQSDSLISTNLLLLGNTGSAAGANTISNLVPANFAYNTSGSFIANQGGGIFQIPPAVNVPNVSFALFYTQLSASNIVYSLTNASYLPGGTNYTGTYTQNGFTYTNTSYTSIGVWGTNAQTGVTVAAIFSEALDDSSLKNLGTQLGANAFTGITNLIVPLTLAQTSTNVNNNGWGTAIATTATTNFLGCKYGKLIGFQTFTTNGVGVCLRDFRVGYPTP